MSLKDEIEKVIRAEQEKLESGDRRRKEFHERQHDRFQPMRALLNDLAASIDAAHLEVSVLENYAVIYVGETVATGDVDKKWEIEPNSEERGRTEKVEHGYDEAPGIRVLETAFPSLSERTHTFDTEEEVMNYLVGEIADKVAFYRYLREKRERER